MATEINPDSWGDYQGNDDDEEIPNKERGCGYLKAGNAYIRSDPTWYAGWGSDDGVLPAFVILTDPDTGELDPIPYKESLPRGYETIAGTNLSVSIEGNIRTMRPLYPSAHGDQETSHQAEHANALENMVEAGVYPDQDVIPESETARHIDRMQIDGIDGEHWGEIDPANSMDLLMRAGKSYYEHPWDFIDEVLELGLNKGISVHDNKRPPRVIPGRTRCWIIHPNGCGEDMPGVIGFVYLTRTIFTRDQDGNVPKYIQEYEASDQVDVVSIGEPEAREDDDDRDGDDVADAHTSLEEFGEFDEDPGFDLSQDDVARAFGDVPDDAGDAGGQQAADSSVREHDPQEIEEMEKANLAALADADDWVDATAPPEEYDALEGDGGLVAIVDSGKISASQNYKFDADTRTARTVLGPYTVRVRLRDDGHRLVEVEK